MADFTVVLRPGSSSVGPSPPTSARSTFFFRIRRRSVQMPADGRPPLRLQHSASRSAQDRLDSGYYDVCESPYLYGYGLLQSYYSCPTPARQGSFTTAEIGLLPRLGTRTASVTSLLAGDCQRNSSAHSTSKGFYYPPAQVRVLSAAAGPEAAAGRRAEVGGGAVHPAVQQRAGAAVPVCGVHVLQPRPRGSGGGTACSTCSL